MTVCGTFSFWGTDEEGSSTATGEESMKIGIGVLNTSIHTLFFSPSFPPPSSLLTPHPLLFWHFFNSSPPTPFFLLLTAHTHWSRSPLQGQLDCRIVTFALVPAWHLPLTISSPFPTNVTTPLPFVRVRHFLSSGKMYSPTLCSLSSSAFRLSAISRDVLFLLEMSS